MRVRKDFRTYVSMLHAHAPIVYPSACVVARCQIDAVCHCSKLQSARLYRDDPNTRALSSSHYGYVLSARVFSLQVPENVVLGEERERLISERWLASKGGGELPPKYCYTMASSSGDKPIECFDAVSRTFMKHD